MDIREISREQWNGMGQHGQIRMKFMGYGPVRIHTDNEKSSYRTDNREICGYMPDTGNGILFR